jgi:hypothetical protein
MGIRGTAVKFTQLHEIDLNLQSQCKFTMTPWINIVYKNVWKKTKFSKRILWVVQNTHFMTFSFIISTLKAAQNLRKVE